MTSSDYREYENGVADVLCSISGSDVAVERNAHIVGRSGASRQIDVLVRGRVFGLTDTTLIADCKRWRNTVDIGDVDAFAGMVEDIGAEFGMLISASTSSVNAKNRAKQTRGVRLITLSIAELSAWRPKGTVGCAVRISEEVYEEAASLLRKQGLRVTEDRRSPQEAGTRVIEVFRHYGASSPSAEVQRGQGDLIGGTLSNAGIEFTRVSHGVVTGGGTPAHRWLNITYGCVKLPAKILVASDDDIRREVRALAPHLGLPAELLDVERPPGWPFTSPFDV